MNFKKILGSFIVGIGVLFILPLFVFADEGHDDVVPHSDVVEVQAISAEPEEFLTNTEEEHGIGDGHTDHTHAEVSFVVWWQSKIWWVMFLVSLFLMTILSFGVYKFLEDKK